MLGKCRYIDRGAVGISGRQVLGAGEQEPPPGILSGPPAPQEAHFADQGDGSRQPLRMVEYLGP